ncbi:hypothetical protein PAHAL_4G337900 [Panicum hallii]|uniref:Uncharacterized protein n=1 Tax=Panicum hallii TaxID=206008 RepID=A0A2S3HM30_9POAL|nr:hypothetical protein PAHAL_4G337900 [Panicum hallii]
MLCAAGVGVGAIVWLYYGLCTSKTLGSREKQDSSGQIKEPAGVGYATFNSDHRLSVGKGSSLPGIGAAT